MKCTFCHADNDRVIDSRAAPDGYVIRRRRECLGCGRRYTTYERMEAPAIKVVKKDHARVPFSRDKIRHGVEVACWKRPVSDEQIDAIVSRVEREVHSQFETEVPSQFLGAMVMQELKELDPVAFVRFASVYRDFSDAHDFVEEIRPMLRGKTK